MAKFKVKDTFTITGKHSVYLQGEILEGTIKKGDKFSLSLNSSISMESEVSEIEFSDGQDGSYICLGLSCSSQDEQDIWLGMNISKGEIYEFYSNT
jgi:hypothetical protein